MEATYIAHHGILGQKWGKQNGPPYPLKNFQKSSAEKKASSTGTSAREVFEMSTGLAYALSSIGTLVGLATGNPLVATGANYVSSAMVAGAAAIIAPTAITSGKNFVNDLRKDD